MQTVGNRVDNSILERMLSLKDLENIDEPIDEDIFSFSEEALKKLDPETREALIRERIRTIIRIYGVDGLSVDEVAKITGHDKRTVTTHLNALENLREVYSHKRNYKLTLYYPNGKPLHTVDKKIVSMGNNTNFEISLAQGPNKELLFHIVEKRFTLLDRDKTEGIIMVPVQGLDEFIKGLEELRDLSGEQNEHN